MKIWRKCEGEFGRNLGEVLEGLFGEVGVYLLCWRNNKEVGIVGVERGRKERSRGWG